MSAPQFTPPPWVVVGPKDAAEQAVHGNGGRSLICRSVLAADARLIAAAPELYEAAKYALGVIGTTNRFDPEQCAAACSALEAALAHARGEGK